MNQLLDYYYKQVVVPFKKYFLHRSSFFYFFLFLLLALSIALLYGSWWVADLVYDSEMKSLLSKKTLTLLIFTPIFCSLMIIFLIIRIFWSKLQKKKGALLRFDLVFLFLVITLFPSFLYIYVLDYILKETMDLYLKDQTIEAYKLSLNSLEQDVNFIRSNTESFLEKNGNDFYIDFEEDKKVSTEWKQLFNDSSVDFLGIRISNKIVHYINKKSMNQMLVGDLLQIVNQSQFDLEQEGYNLEKNYILVKKILNNQKNISLFAFTIPHYSLPKEIKSTMQVATRVSQIRLLSLPIKNMLLFLYFYFYFPILSLGIFIFYLKSKNITSPIGELNQAVKNISKNNFNFKVEVKGNNEITELINSFKYMTKELLLNKEKLKIMSKMEAWRDVAIHLAHELKNPLTPIKLANDRIGKKVMKANFDLYSELLPSFNLINREIKTIGELIRQFFDHSKEIKVHKKKVNMCELMESFKDYLMHHSEIKSELTSNISPDTEVFIDERAIRQVLNNLIHNAIDSVQGASKKVVNIEGSQIKRENQLWVMIKVIDNGAGIPENLKSKIFIPYFTTKESGKGLGLSISESILKKHNGHLTFTSDKNKTTFSILIPVVNQ